MRKSVFISIPPTSTKILHYIWYIIICTRRGVFSPTLGAEQSQSSAPPCEYMSADVAFFLLSLPVFLFSTQLPIVFTHVVHSLIRGDNNLWHLVLCCRCDQLDNSQSHASPSIAVHSQDRGSGSGFTGTRPVECWSSRSVARMLRIL